MELMIICILTFYFAIGGVAIWLINRKKDPVTAREGWVKYFVYLAIVLVLIFSNFNYYSRHVVLGAILVISLIEVVYAIVQSATGKYIAKIICLCIFISCAFGFFEFYAWNGKIDVLLVYLIVFSFDGFSQISGQLFGKKKLVSKISPQKTIAGFTGGMLMGTLTGVLFFGFVSNFIFNFWFITVQCLIICTAAFLGDLGASYMKRVCGIKDYSNLIPGHGGILDRFDSFIGAGAVTYFITFILNYA